MNERFTDQNSALVLIDHQIGTMQLIKNLDLSFVSRMTIALAKAARILQIPVVLTSSLEDQVQGRLLPELADLHPEAYAARIKRIGVVNAWDESAFVAAVKATGRKNLIMAGVTTDICLVFAAIDAVRDGYGVQAVLDASGSPFELSEDASRRRMENAGVVLTTTNTLLAELAHNWSRPEGQKVIELLFSDVLPEIKPA